MFAEIILNASAKQLNKVFDYIVPQELEKKIQNGNRVLVPFGSSNKIKEGFIVNLKQNSKFANKSIISIRKRWLKSEKI